VQALILSPTRELAQQTEKNLLAVGDFMNVQAHCCIGGHSVGEDIRKLENGVHVVSGTPGRCAAAPGGALPAPGSAGAAVLARRCWLAAGGRRQRSWR
jgi:hypothetical protein